MAISSSMAIHTLVDVAPHLPPHVSVLIRGPHGIGKSQICRQIADIIAKKEGIDDYEFIDQRLSQKTEGDLIGLPSTDGEVTRFNPPDWYKRACVRPCFILLDELNRATQEVMQAGFQIVLDYELNGWKLHPQTRVYAAVNASAEYTVNEMDPALIDRFWVVDLAPDVKDWIAWARDKGNVVPEIVDFQGSNDGKWLDPPKNAEIGGKYPSRRSWERLSISLKHAGISSEPENPKFYQMSIGFLGVEAAIAFTDFAKNYDKRISGKDIVESYDKVKSKVARYTADRLNGLIDKVAEYVTQNLEVLNDKQGENLRKFLSDIGAEHRVSCWTKLTATGIDKLPLARSIHKHCASTIIEVFGVPMGNAGIGVVPNVPGIFTVDKGKKK